MRPRASTSKRCDEHIEALWRVHRRAVASTSKRCESHRQNGVVHTARMESFTPPESNRSHRQNGVIRWPWHDCARSDYCRVPPWEVGSLLVQHAAVVRRWLVPCRRSKCMSDRK